MRTSEIGKTDRFEKMLKRRETGLFRIMKGGAFAGVTVELLPNDAILVKGLRPEWPPWVRLEPKKNCVSISFDGIEWQERRGQSEFWILRALDPRQVLRRSRLLSSSKKGRITRIRGVMSIGEERAVPRLTDTGTALVTELAEPLEIETKGAKLIRLTQRFPISKEWFTLESDSVATKRASESSQPRSYETPLSETEYSMRVDTKELIRREKSAIDRAEKSLSKRIFVVHGHDAASNEELTQLLKKAGLEPVILREQPAKGRAIAEKLEDVTSDVDFACVLLTPDDLGSHRGAKPDELRPRARQNVIFELGYLLAKFGRDRVLVLYKDSIEKPSDIRGVVHLPFHESVRETYPRILEALHAAGYNPPKAHD